MPNSTDERRKDAALRELNVMVIAGHALLPSNREAQAALLVAAGKIDVGVLHDHIERLSVRDLSKLITRAQTLIEEGRI